jgi:hypothetical protein
MHHVENRWNLPFTAPVEMLSWEALSKEQLAGAQIIGFVEEVEAEEVWDCFQNHYEDYDWSELVQCNLSEYFSVLGWTEASWNGEAPPPASENSIWANLTKVEQDAAGRICFFNYTWDGVNIVDWSDLDSISSNTTTEEIGVITDPTPSDDTVTTTSPQQVLGSTTDPLIFETPIPLTPIMPTIASVEPPTKCPHCEPPEPV